MWGARHDQPYHVIGSDASGVVLRVGSAVRNWKPGDAVTVHCNHVDDQDPSAHDDSMLATNQRIWGFETNFGGLAEISGREGEPAHAEARAPHVGGGGGATRCTNSTSYRMIVSPNGSQMTQGQTVLDLGRDRRHRRVRVPVRAQRRRHAGRRRVVARSAPSCCTSWASSTSSTARPRATSSGTTSTTQDPAEWRRLGKKIRELVGHRPRHRVRAPRPLDDGRVGVRRASAAG